ncbi:MAG: 4Fe-4S dicluster domain-containing protein, partial [Aliifodinibius sp.]|nr:4Fe-4S dicluster domain-containing protein [Fodinibius sp.]
QVNAIEMMDGKAAVKLDNCIGCGLCVTSCPAEAAKLYLIPEEERIDPPFNYEVWEENRLKDRGLANKN